MALDALTSGANNIAIGKDALGASVAGNHNIAIGNDALKSFANADGNANVAIGGNAMDSANANMIRNTVVGFSALNGANHADADQNTAIGAYAGQALTQGSLNTFIGDGSGYNSTTVIAATCVGVNAGRGAMTTDANGSVFVGADAGYSNTTGQYNTVVGGYAFDLATELDNNVAIGYQALTAASHSARVTNNTAVGYRAGYGVTTGIQNTLMGSYAGDVLTTGGQNTIIGYACDTNNVSRSGTVIIGSSITQTVDTDNVVEIGNGTNSMTYDLDGGDITITSDIRTKKNIQESKIGLEFINKLRPITYETRPTSEYPDEFQIPEESKNDKTTGRVWDGLISQEVKAVMDEMDVGFSGWSENIYTKQQLQYGKFVMPLIKAVQELSEKVESQQKEIEELKKQ